MLRGRPASVLDSPAFSCQPPRSLVALHYGALWRGGPITPLCVSISLLACQQQQQKKSTQGKATTRAVHVNSLCSHFSAEKGKLSCSSCFFYFVFFIHVHSVLKSVATSQVLAHLDTFFIPSLTTITLLGIPSVFLSLVLSYLPQFAAVVMKDLTCTEQNNPNRKWSLAKKITPPKPPPRVHVVVLGVGF